MAGTRTAPVNTSPKYFAADVQQDTTTFLANDAAILSAVFGGWNILQSGCALSAGAGMVVNVAQGQVVVDGVVIAVPAGPVTLAAAGAQPRYDLVYALLGTTAGGNASGQPNVTDSVTLGVQTGTGGGSPTKGALPGMAYAQLGSVYVPAGAGSASACTLFSADTAPNAQGYKSLVDLLVHIGSAITSAATVHGIRQGAGNGFDADTVDGSHAAAFDAAGAAAGVQTNLTAETTARTTADSTEVTNRTNADVAHAALSHYSQLVHGVETRRGQQAVNIVSGNGDVTYAVTFSPAMAGVPQAITFGVITNGSVQVAAIYASGVTASGFTLHASSTGTLNATVTWVAHS